MNSFIPWVGGKGKLLWIINKMAPERYSRFIDVFGGSGTVTMNRPTRKGCMRFASLSFTEASADIFTTSIRSSWESMWLFSVRCLRDPMRNDLREEIWR